MTLQISSDRLVGSEGKRRFADQLETDAGVEGRFVAGGLIREESLFKLEIYRGTKMSAMRVVADLGLEEHTHMIGGGTFIAKKAEDAVLVEAKWGDVDLVRGKRTEKFSFGLEDPNGEKILAELNRVIAEQITEVLPPPEPVPEKPPRPLTAEELFNLPD